MSDATRTAAAPSSRGPGHTQFAATVAVAHGVTVAPSALRSTRPSVLPRVEHGAEGALRLVHDAGDRYRLGDHLGMGGMGEAFRAEDVDIGREVAIKRLLPNAASPTGLARFVEEVHIVGGLEHPNVVPLHDVGLDHEGRYFFVMKYVHGETLERVIERLLARDPEALAQYTVERRIEIFLGVLNALAYAHERGILHRDVKPANVMIGRLGEVWLMDWGVAKRMRGGELPCEEEAAAPASVAAQVRTTRHGTLVGTPAYMAPEQACANHAAVDERSDLYAACVMFHELLSLRHYLADKMVSLPGLLRAVEHEEAGHARVGSAAPGEHVPAELVHFLVKGLAKDPKARWQSAREMSLQLHRVLEGKVHVQCLGTMTKRMAREAGRFVDRHPVAAFMMFALGVAAVLGLAVSFVWRLVA